MNINNKFKHSINAKGTYKFSTWLFALPNFLFTVYKSGKIRELISFVIWEILYKLNLLGKPIQFNANTPILLNEDHLDKEILVKELNHLLQDNQFSAESIDKLQLKMIFLVGKKEGWACPLLESNVLLHLKIENNTYNILHKYSFPTSIQSIFVNTSSSVFVATNGLILRSDKQNREVFEEVIQLSYPKSTFLFYNGMEELPNGVLLLGEYGNVWQDMGWVCIANLYYSFDGGKKWVKTDFLIKQGVNKHVHIIKYFQHCAKLILTDGDNKKQIWIKNNSLNFSETTQKHEDWKLLTRFHIQMGGYTAAAELGKKAILGTDYLGGTNFIVETDDFVHFKKEFLPNPYRRAIVETLQTTKHLLWALIFPPTFNNSRGLLMIKKEGDRHWQKLIEYNRIHYAVRIVSNSLIDTHSIIISIIHKKTKENFLFTLEDIQKKDEDEFYA